MTVKPLFFQIEKKWYHKDQENRLGKGKLNDINIPGPTMQSTNETLKWMVKSVVDFELVIWVRVRWHETAPSLCTTPCNFWSTALEEEALPCHHDIKKVSNTKQIKAGIMLIHRQITITRFLLPVAENMWTTNSNRKVLQFHYTSKSQAVNNWRYDNVFEHWLRTNNLRWG